MVRKARVELEAEVGGFIPEMDASAHSVHNVDDKVEALDRDLKKLPADAVKAAAAMKLLGTESDSMGRKIQGVGDKSTSMNMLNNAIVHTRGEVRRLGEEFNRTGNVSVFGHLMDAQKDLKTLEGFQKQLTGALRQGSADGGREGAKAFSAGMQGGLSTPILGPILVGAITAAVLAALPAVNGLLLSAAGFGGIGLGILGQLKDPKVARAVTDMGHDLSATLTDATTSFREPLIGSVKIFGDALKSAIGSINFDKLAGLLPELAQGFADLLSKAMPGFNRMLDSSAVKEFAALLPAIGHGVDDMFAAFARGDKGAVEGLRALVQILVGAMRIIGFLVEMVSKLFSGFVDLGSGLAHFFGKAFEAWPFVKHIFDGMADAIDKIKNGFSDGGVVVGKSFKHVGDNASMASDEIGKLIGKIGSLPATIDQAAAALTDKLIGGMLNLDQATLGVDKALITLGDTLVANGGHLSDHVTALKKTETGAMQNKEAVLAVVEANLRMYDAQIAVGISAEDAAAKYHDNTGALEDQLRAAGWTETAITGLIGKYRDVPTKVNTIIAMQGLEYAIDRLADIIASVNNLSGRHSTTYIDMITHHVDIYTSDYMGFNALRVGTRGNLAGGIYEHAQEGKLRDAQVFSTKSPARYAFAEPATGGEAFVPRRGDYARSTAILDQAARWYGGRFMAAAGDRGGGGMTINAPITINGVTDPEAVGAVVDRKLRQAVRSANLMARGG